MTMDTYGYHGQVKQTGAEGERMKEGAMINKSLLLGLGQKLDGSEQI